MFGSFILVQLGTTIPELQKWTNLIGYQQESLYLSCCGKMSKTSWLWDEWITAVCVKCFWCRTFRICMQMILTKDFSETYWHHNSAALWSLVTFECYATLIYNILTTIYLHIIVWIYIHINVWERLFAQLCIKVVSFFICSLTSSKITQACLTFQSNFLFGQDDFNIDTS